MSAGQQPETQKERTHTPVYPRLVVKHRKTLLIVGLITATCLLSWIVGLPGVAGVKQFRESGVILAEPGGVEFRADTSKIRIRPSTDGKVHVAVRGQYSGARPRVALNPEDGSVLVVVDCFAEPGRDCTLNVNLEVPPGSPLRAKTSSGPLDVTGISGPSSYTTDSGPVTLNNVSGSVIVTTLSGMTRGTRLTGQRYTVSSKSGSVSLDLAVVPASVKIDSGKGQTNLVVPPATYRVKAQAGDGAVTVAVPQSATAFSQLTLTTDGSPIRVRATSAQTR